MRMPSVVLSMDGIAQCGGLVTENRFISITWRCTSHLSGQSALVARHRQRSGYTREILGHNFGIPLSPLVSRLRLERLDSVGEMLAHSFSVVCGHRPGLLSRHFPIYLYIYMHASASLPLRYPAERTSGLSEMFQLSRERRALIDSSRRFTRVSPTPVLHRYPVRTSIAVIYSFEVFFSGQGFHSLCSASSG